MTAAPNRDGFPRLLLAEWTKLRTVRRWVIALYAAGFLTVGLSLLAASGNTVDYYNQYPNFVVGPTGLPVADDFYFVHQPVSGDATVTVRVANQVDSNEWAGAGVMIKESLRSGSAYAAVLLTPRHGARMQSNFETDIAAGSAGTPHWLRLTRTGTTMTGYTSTDGTDWREIGRLRLSELPSATQVGFFVSSPPVLTFTRSGGGVHGDYAPPVMGQAVFDHVSVTGTGVSESLWRGDDVRRPRLDLPGGQFVEEGGQPGAVIEDNGTFTVTGFGEIGPQAPDDDIVQIALFGIIAGVIVVVVVAVLSVTSEYRRGMIGATLAATPRRGRVLSAKALVLGVTAFAIGLMSSVIALLVSRPVLREHGYAPPAFPPVSVFDPPVLRALILTGAFVAAMAVFSVGIGVIMRHSAAAITTVLSLILIPVIVSAALPLTPALWLVRLTPVGGLATQRAQPPTAALSEAWSMIGPWTGLAVVATYAAGSMVGAWWLLRRRDS